MTDAQGWTSLGLVGVLLGVIGGLVVQQVRQVGDRLDTRIHGLEATFGARLTGFESSVDARFDAVDRRFGHLERDVQALVRARFRRDE